MDIEKIIEDILGKDAKVVAIGDVKRYEANKILLGKSRYVNYKDISSINKNNTDVVVICDELMEPIVISDIPTIHLYEIINNKAAKFWDNKKEYVGVDLNHSGSNKYISEYISKIRKTNFETILKDGSTLD